MTDTIYKEMILDLYRNPLNKKRLALANLSATGENPMCGDEMHIEIELDKQGRVQDIGFSGDGCAISLAAASLITDAVKQKTSQEIQTMGEEEMIELLHIPISYTRKKCALLGLKTIQHAFEKTEHELNESNG